ncbi:MAG: hypothetical protein QOF89_1106 [Acidobacteriota bacterium]|nr:hypothetical protein [Acidobacteriota bacterium]
MLRARISATRFRRSSPGGPRGKGGGLSLTLYQRDDGAVRTALTIECSALSDGTLRISVSPALPFTLADETLRIETTR